MKKDQFWSHDFDNAERIGYLISRFIQRTLTAMERRELDAWLLESEENELLFDELTREENVKSTMQWYASLNEKKAKQNLQKRIPFVPQRRKVSLPFIGIAASLILIVGLGIFFIWSSREGVKVTSPEQVALATDPQPGKDKAVLTIAGGKQVVLDNSAGKTLAGENIRIAEGTVFYTGQGPDVPAENTLTVPRGGQYKLVLPDGTRVWLNAESSLSFPTAFTGGERRVSLRGEGYFEVTKNKEKPFIVEASGNTIRVLGTQFNVNSYGDENVFTTTLVEGSVQISKARVSKILQPGQQARVAEDNIEVVPVDVKQMIAWKDGNFVFRNAPVPVIVNQLARWYDLDVEYREPVEKHLNAIIKRDVPLSKVLHYLEETGDVHFKSEGRKLIVLK